MAPRVLTRLKTACADLAGIPPMEVVTRDRVDMTEVAAGANADKTAVVICHGMGQQVRWQTLATLVDTLRQSGRVKSVGTRLARFADADGELILGRVEVTVVAPDGGQRELHLYEPYWAPIAEGRVRLRDVISFLKDAGTRGIRHSFRPFVRFMFGRPHQFPRTPFVALPLACVLAVFLALLSLNASIAAITAQGMMNLSWSLDGDRSKVTLYVALVEAAALVYLLVTTGVAAFRTRKRRRNPGYFVGAATQRGLRALLGIVGILTVAAGVLVPLDLAQMGPSWLELPSVGARLPGGLTAAVWAVAAWLALRTRALLIEYVGDVVVYVSAFQVSRFDTIRDRIQAVGRRVLCAVYASGGYGSHVVAGHSLGSVVAYDALNAAIAKDRWEPALQMRVVERTRAFITFGSPLDKIAYIFRTQSRDGDVREALASQVQPLIDDRRRPRWINIFSPQDPISGSLDFFDHPGEADCRVENVADRQADLPLWAHTQYWANRTLGDALLGACLGAPERRDARAAEQAPVGRVPLSVGASGFRFRF